MERSLRKSITVNEMEYLLRNVGKEERASLIPALFEDPRVQRIYLLKEEIRRIKDLRQIAAGIVKDVDCVEAIVNTFWINDDLILPQDVKDVFTGSHKIAFFVGAGVSRLIGIPLWEELAYEALRFLNEQNYINESEADYLKRDSVSPRQIISIFHQIIKDPKVQTAFYKSKLQAKKENPYPNPYELLFELENVIGKPVIKISTNLDRAWHDVLFSKEESRKRKTDVHGKIINPVPIYLGCQETGFKKETVLNDKILYQTHGNLDNIERAILTTEAYVKHYNDDDGLKGFLGDIFKSHTVFFMGYGLQEFEILVHCLKGASRSASQHFALVGTDMGRENLFRVKKAYFSDINVRAIPYYFDFHSYHRLIFVLDSWVSVLKASKGAKYYDELKQIDEVV